MNTTPRSFALVSLVLALVAGASEARSQGSNLTVRSSRSDTGSVAPGGVFTAPFAIVNRSNDSVQTSPVITLPKGWTTVNSLAPSSVAANGMELWLLSVSAPAAAPAGMYVIRAGIRTGDVTTTDSMLVAIEEHRELELHSVNAANFVLSGSTYDAHFIIRNKGNVPSRMTLRATSNRGAIPKLSATQLDLDGGASTTITVSVTMPSDIDRSMQELLEVVAIDTKVDSVRADASIETTVIPDGSHGPEFWTIPGSISFRAAGAGAGVSPIVASGSGRISQYSDISVDYSLRGKTGPASIFGEREEYRLGLSNKHGGVRVGDDNYGYSLLTSSGGQGTGAELHANSENLTGGVYMQRNRLNPTAPTEVGAMIGTAADGATTGRLVALERGKAGITARIIGATASRNFKRSTLELEAAASDSVHLGGTAAIARFYGDASTFSYDIGGQAASNGFAGQQHAATDQHATVSGKQVGPMTLSAMTSIHTLMPTVQSAGFGQKIATTSLTANFVGGSAVELERFERTDHGSSSAIRGNQQSVRVRGHHMIGSVDLQGSLQNGIVAQADSSSHGFMTVSGSVRMPVGKEQYVSVYSEMSDGRGIGAGGVGTVTGGGNTELKLGAATTLRVSASLTAQRDRLADWSSQGDFTIERAIRTSIVALRARMSESGSSAVRSNNAFYLEVRTPLRLPTSHLDVGGRAKAQVVDAETGKAVAGAMVRLGEQAAITDKNGTASFRGLVGGEYHAAVVGGIAAGQLVTGGDAINVAQHGATAAFTLNVARGAHVVARLRAYEKNANVGMDSIVDVGAVSPSVVALIGSRDTLWQSSDDRGRIDFGSVAPGHYTVSVVAGDVPEFMAFEKKQIDLDVSAGDQREVEFRLVPQTRTVEFVGAETVLVAAPVVAAPVPQARATPIPNPMRGRNQQYNRNNDSN